MMGRYAQRLTHSMEKNACSVHSCIHRPDRADSNIKELGVADSRSAFRRGKAFFGSFISGMVSAVCRGLGRVAGGVALRVFGASHPDREAVEFRCSGRHGPQASTSSGRSRSARAVFCRPSP
jgi:hypothetical protein